MPRIYQLEDQYLANDFWRDIDRQCGWYGLKPTKLCNEIGISNPTIKAYRDDPGKIQIKTIRKMVELLKPDIFTLLRLLGYSEKEITAFAKAMKIKQRMS